MPQVLGMQTAQKEPRALPVPSRTVLLEGDLKNAIQSSIVCLIVYCLLTFFCGINISSVRSETKCFLACGIPSMQNE